MGLGVGGPGQGLGQGLGPGGVDGCTAARPEPGGLHQFGGHDPGRIGLGQGRAGEDGEMRAARPLIVVLGLPASPLHVQAILPYTSGSLLEQVRQLGRVDSLEYRADGVALSADVDDRLAAAVLDQAIDQKPLQASGGDTPSAGRNS